MTDTTDNNLPLTGANGQQQGDGKADAKAKVTRSAADNDAALLAQYSLSHLEPIFSIRNEDNSILQEREPCYQCMADGFYGRGTAGTWYMEGSIIVTEVVPNQHMQPLNRAAGIRYARWLASLPNNRAAIDVGDMAEAAQMLAKNPEVTNLSPLDYQNAVIRLSEELKLRREGKNARSMPGIEHNFNPQSGGNAPPILGAKLSDMSQRGPGFNSGPAPAAQPGGARRVQSALGGTPPGR